MHNLFKIKVQKKKRDEVEGRSSAKTLKHVINVKTLFFEAIYMNYNYYYFLLIYKLCNKQIKQPICTPTLSGHACLITLFFLDLVTLQYCRGYLYFSIFLALARPELKI